MAVLVYDLSFKDGTLTLDEREEGLHMARVLTACVVTEGGRVVEFTTTNPGISQMLARWGEERRRQFASSLVDDGHGSSFLTPGQAEDTIVIVLGHRDGAVMVSAAKSHGRWVVYLSPVSTGEGH